MKSSKSLVLAVALLIPVSGCTITEAVEPQPTRVYQTPTKTYKPAPTSSAFSQQQLDALLAPVALYPDSLLSHILIASTYPLEVVEADRWVKNNSRLQGEDAVKAVESKNWDPSVKALVAFPDVLKRMSEDLDWTQQLGDAFLEDEGQVMDSIQSLRQKADAAGNLGNTDHVKVVREERVIYIEPAVERVVYVPVYDTRVVYGPWWWPDYPPVYWHRYSSQVYFSGSFYWGPRVYIGPSFHFSSCHWRDRRVVIIDHHHHRDYYSHRHAYTGRHLAHYNGARHWSHNPVHRRGVAYYNEPVRARYSSNREPTRNAWDERQRSRDRAGVISVNPDRQERANRQQRTEGRLPRDNNRQITDRAADNNVSTNRAESLRTRMSERRQTRVESRTEVDNRNDNNRWQIGNDSQGSNEPREVIRRQNENRESDNRSWRNRTESTQESAPRTSVDRQDSGRLIRRFEDRSSSDNSQRQPRMETQRNTTREFRQNNSDNSGGRRFTRERE
jgi:hypothetical protein